MRKQKHIKRYTDGEMIEHEGRTLRVRFEADDSTGPPWEEFDGHGVITGWQGWLSEKEAKAQGLWLLHSDRRLARYYDARASLTLAINDGWGRGKSLSAKRRAVKRDYEYLRGWCNDDWCYIGVVVETEDGKENESLCGIESNAYAHIAEMVKELAATLHARLPGVGAAEYTLTVRQRTAIVTALHICGPNLDIEPQEIEELCEYLNT